MESMYPGDYQSPSQLSLALNVIDSFNQLLVASGGDIATCYVLVIDKGDEPYGDFVVARLDRTELWEYVSDLEDRMAAELRWSLRNL